MDAIVSLGESESGRIRRQAASTGRGTLPGRRHFDSTRWQVLIRCNRKATDLLTRCTGFLQFEIATARATCCNTFVLVLNDNRPHVATIEDFRRHGSTRRIKRGQINLNDSADFLQAVRVRDGHNGVSRALADLWKSGTCIHRYADFLQELASEISPLPPVTSSSHAFSTRTLEQFGQPRISE